MPLAFRQGMAERAAILGDAGDWAPNGWEGALGRKDIHVLVAASCMGGEVADYWRQIGEAAQGGAQPGNCADFIGCTLIHKEVGDRIEKNPEVGQGEAKEQFFTKRFSFQEGVGQPKIEGADPTQAPTASAAGESEPQTILLRAIRFPRRHRPARDRGRQTRARADPARDRRR